MPPSRLSPDRTPLIAPVVDYEPPPITTASCPPPLPPTLHRRVTRPPHPHGHPPAEPSAPHAAAVFADAALRRVLEVVDRRRPVAALRPLLDPALIDAVVTLSRARAGADGTAMLRRVRVRGAGPDAAEVFATYTRGSRVRAIAARIELTTAGRWRMVALQVG